MAPVRKCCNCSGRFQHHYFQVDCSTALELYFSSNQEGFTGVQSWSGTASSLTPPLEVQLDYITTWLTYVPHFTNLFTDVSWM
eukprot:2885079-Amphidinium_carterae.2